MNLLVLLLITVEIIDISHGHLLPEDSENDDAEQLNREKRDDFLNNILKTIPFFNVAPSESSLKDEDDPNDIEEDSVSTLIITASPTSSSSLVTTVSESVTSPVLQSSSYVLSATVVPTATSFNVNTTTIYVTKTPSLTSSYVLRTASFPYSSLPMVQSTVSEKTKSSMIITPTESMKKLLTSASYSYPTASSSVVMMPVSSIEPSPMKTMAVSSSAIEESQQVIKMMIIADDPLRGFDTKLPEEIGYGDTLARAPTGEESEIKNIRFLYSNVLIPVMSGIFGALLITFGIIMYKCVRRRKLQKVRYYGGKPNSGLYRLDQMSLLSELTSDEED